MPAPPYFSGRTFWGNLGLRLGPGHDALQGAAHLPDAVCIPGAEEGVQDERGHVARQVAEVLREGVDVSAAGEPRAEGCGGGVGVHSSVNPICQQNSETRKEKRSLGV